MALTQTQVSQLYVSIFGRASEGDGNTYWQTALDSMAATADAMLATDAAATYFGTSLDDDQAFIEHIYLNTLGKTYAEDTEGVDYWVAELATGVSRGQVVANMINAAMDPQYAGLAAQDQFINKVAVSDYTADTSATADASDLLAFTGYISGVTDDEATVTAAKAFVDAAANNVTYHTLTEIEDTPGEQVLMWGYTPNETNASQGIPVADLLEFLGNITNIDLFELGLIDDDGVSNGVDPADVISNITIGDIDADDQSTVIITTTDGEVITGEASLGEDYMNFLSNLIFDNDGNSRLYMVTEEGEEGGAIVLTPSQNNNGTFEMGFTSNANDTIIAGRTELLHGAYIDGGGGYDTLEVDMKGIYAQPLQLLNIELINVQNLPNVYDEHGEYNDNQYGTGSILDLSRATALETLIVTEGFGTGVDLGDLTIVGIRNGATARLEGGFSEDVNLHYGAGLGDAVNLELNLGDTSEDFTLNVAHNSNTLNIDSQMGENAIDSANFGDGVLSNLNITGDAALYIGSNLSDSFHDGRTATIDASENTGGVDLLLDGQPDVSFTGSSGNDDFTANYGDNVIIVDLKGDNTLTTDGNETVNITTGSGVDEISSIGSVEVTIDAGDDDNTVVASAADITVATGVHDDSITIAGTEGGTEDSAVAGVTGVNLMFIIDNSSSLNAQQLADEKAAANTLLDHYVALGLDTAVRLVMFSPADSTYNGSNEAWLSVADAKAVIAAMDGNGYTDFDEALNTSIAAWDGNPTGSQPTDMTLFNSTNAANQVVFMSDGQNSVTTQVQTDWEAFLSTNGITSHAFGFGASDSASIAPVAYDGLNSQQIDPVLVTDSQDLIDTITVQVGGEISGISGNQAVINIDAGAGQNTLILGDDDQLSQGLTALTGSVITGENISLHVDASSDISQAEVTGVANVMLEGSTNLKLSAEQFIAIGAGNFAVENSAFGEDATLTIVTDKSMHFDDLGITTETFDCNNINLYIELACNSAEEVTFTLTAEQLHEYIAINGINVDSNNDYDNDQVVVTDASLDFDAFGQSTDDNGNVIASGGGTIANGIGEQDVTVLRSLDGYSRPSEDDLVDMMTINSDETLDAVPGFGDADTLLKTLVIEGDADIAFEGAINLADSFTVDFSALTGAIDGLTLAEFEDIYVNDTWGEIIGNGDARVNIQVTNGETVGYDDIQQGGVHSSGVSTFVVTDINNHTTGNEGEVLSQNIPGQTAAIFVCDSTQGVETLGLQNNRNAAVTFENVNWGTTILLEGDGYANSSDQEKNLGDPDLSEIGAIVANYFEPGANVVVNINNQGVPLGMSEDAEDGYDLDGERVLDVAGITVNNADRLTINVEDGDAVINDVTAVDVERLIVTGPEDVAIAITVAEYDNEPGSESGLDTDDLLSIDASRVLGEFTLNLTGDYDFSEVELNGIDALVLNDNVDLTLNAEQVVELGAVIIDDGDDTALSIVEFSDQPLDLSVIDVDDLGTVTFADIDGTIIVDPATVFGNAVNAVKAVDALTILAEESDTTVEMTAAQFNQVQDAAPEVDDGTPGIDPTTGDAFVATLVLTDLAADTVIDLENVETGIENIVRVDGGVDGVIATEDMSITNGDATLEVAGTTDLTAADIAAIDTVDLAAEAELTLTADQVFAIGFADLNEDDIADAWSGLAGSTLNITDLTTQALDLDLIAAAGINIGTVAIEDTDAAVTIHDDTTFGDADEIVTPTKDAGEAMEATSPVTMTVAQFVSSAGTISGDSQVNLTGLVNNTDTDEDYVLDTAQYDLSAIDNAGTITLGDQTVRLADATEATDTTEATDATDLGDFEIQLANGQMIQFATDVQATGTTVTEISGTTAIAWLFDTITAQIDTTNYDGDINTLYVNEDLVDGQNEEDLWNTLPGTIAVEKVNNADIPDVLISFDRINTFEALTAIDGVSFDDLQVFQTIENLTINLEGNTNIGYVLVGDTVIEPGEPEGIFDTLTINSYEDRTTLDDPNTPADEDTGFTFQPNKVGDISLAPGSLDNLVNIVIGTGVFNDLINVNGGAAVRDGLAIEVGTITFESQGTFSQATLTLTGDNDITIDGVNISDPDITLLHIDNNTTAGDVEIGGVNQDALGDAILADATDIYVMDGFVAPAGFVFGDGEGVVDQTSMIEVVNGTVDLTEPTVNFDDVGALHVSGDDVTITLTAAQIIDIGEGDFSVAAGVVNVTLNVTELGNAALDLNTIQDAGFNIGEVSTVEDSTGQVDTVLNAGTSLGGADQLTILLNDEDNTLTLTATQYQQITAGNIVELDSDATVVNAADVTVTDLNGIATDTNDDTIVDTANIDLSTVAVTGAMRLELADVNTAADLTIDALSDLGGFTVVLDSQGLVANDLLGQTVRFSTAVQAERAIDVINDGDPIVDNGTNVVWLFDSITKTADGSRVDTSDYDVELGRVWMLESLVDGAASVEELFTSLNEATIIRVVNEDDLTAILPATGGFGRHIEIETFTTLGDLTFSDIDEAAVQPFDFVENLTIDLGGNVVMGDITVSNVLAAPISNNDEFETMTINSFLASATHATYLLPEDFTYGNAPGQVPYPTEANEVGDIKAGDDDFDMANVVINTGTAGSGGNDLVAGTVYFSDDGEDANGDAHTGITATFTITGDGDVTVKSLDTIDPDITALTVINGTGILTVTGGSPAAAVADTETLAIVTTTGDVVFGSVIDPLAVPLEYYAGVDGPELSTIYIMTDTGDVDLGVLADIDGSLADPTDLTTGFNLNVLTGGGVVTSTLGMAVVDGIDTAPELAAGESWSLEDMNLTITEDVTFNAGGTLFLHDVALTIEGDVDLSILVDDAGTATLIEGLFLTGTTAIDVPVGAILTLTAAQIDGVTITGAGTVEVLDLEGLPGVDLSSVMTGTGDTGSVNAYVDTSDDDDIDALPESIALTGANLGVVHVTIAGDGDVSITGAITPVDRNDPATGGDTSDDVTPSFTAGAAATLNLTAAQAGDTTGDAATSWNVIADGAGTVAVADLSLNADADLSGLTATTVTAAVDISVTFTGDLGTAVVTVATGADLQAAGSVLDGVTIDGAGTVSVDDENDGAAPDTALDIDLSNITAYAIEFVADAEVGIITFPTLYTIVDVDPVTPGDQTVVQTVTLTSVQADGQTILGATAGADGAVVVNIDDTVDGDLDGDVDAFDLSNISAGAMTAIVDNSIVFDTAVDFGNFDIQILASATVTMTGAQADGRTITETSAAELILTDVQGGVDLTGLTVDAVTAKVSGGTVDLSGVSGLTGIDVLDGDSDPLTGADLTLGADQFGALKAGDYLTPADLANMSSLTVDVIYTISSTPFNVDLDVDPVTGNVTGSAAGIVQAQIDDDTDPVTLGAFANNILNNATIITHTDLGNVVTADSGADGFGGIQDIFEYEATPTHSAAITTFSGLLGDGDKLDMSIFGDSDSTVTTIGPNEVMVNNEVFFTTGAPNTADSVAASAAEITADGAVWVEGGGINAYFVIADDNSSAIYEYNQVNNDGVIATDELTLIGTVDTNVVLTDIIA